MKRNEFLEMTDDQLFERAGELRESLFRLRFRLALGHTEAVRQLRAERKQLARIKTELRAREVKREIEQGMRPARRNLSRAERRERTARRLRAASAG